MMETPLISVVMSTLNPNEGELRKSVESIINQTISSWELLIYDDGSSEDKRALIQEISRLDKRIHYIRGNSNRGIAAGLNECLKVANGIYVARMDDDDICLSERFEKQMNFLDANTEYQWVGVLADLFDENGIWGRADRPEKPESVDFFHSSPFIHPSVMFRKSILLDNGGYKVSKETARCEDYELFMRLYAKGYKGYNLQEVLFRYREESGVLKRSWKYCFNETKIRWYGFRELQILSCKNVLFVFKPLAVRAVATFPRLAQKIRVRKNKGDHIAVEKRN